MKITRDNAREAVLGFREDRGITQEKLSKDSNISVPTIINIEKGIKKPHALTIYRLNSYFRSLEEEKEK